MDAHARPSRRSAGARAPSGRPGRAGGRRPRTRLPGEGFAPAAGPARRDVPATGRLARGAGAGRSERRHALRSGAPPGARVKDAVGAVQSLLVLGGTSEIGLATARTLVEGRTRRVALAARDPVRAEAGAQELRALGAEVDVLPFDARDFGSHAALVDGVFDGRDDIDCALVAFGVLGDQERLASDGAAAAEAVETNYVGAVSVCIPLAERMSRQGHGTI